MADASETDETRATGGTARATTTQIAAERSGEDDDIGAALAAITTDGQRLTAALTGSLGAEHAAAIELARRYMSKDALAALVAALRRARQATIAASRQQNTTDATGRQDAVKRARRRVPRPRHPSP